MDFSDALRAMKEGKAVRRAIWGTDVPRLAGASTIIATPQLPGMTLSPQILVVYTDGRANPWGCSQWDVLSDDWELFPMADG